MTVKLKFPFDTVKYGQDMEVILLYKNKTDSMLTFYSEANILLLKSVSQAFILFDTFYEAKRYSDSSMLILNNIVDFRNTSEINSQSTYSYIFHIKAVAPFFTKGENKVRVIYSCKPSENAGKKTLKLFNKYCSENRICGKLESKEVKLFVID
jgi:hypothetical protein